MVTKTKKAAGKKKKVKVLSLKRETLKDLTGGETKRVRGGASVIASAGAQCAGISRGGAGTGTGTTLGPTCGLQTATGPSGVLH